MRLRGGLRTRAGRRQIPRARRLAGRMPDCGVRGLGGGRRAAFFYTCRLLVSLPVCCAPGPLRPGAIG
eukprot:11355291-Alexandrium_andersonii.AAC.1